MLPLISTPIAIIASKGAVEGMNLVVGLEGEEGSSAAFRSEVLAESRSVALDRMLVLVEVAWACEVVHIFCTA